VQFHARKQILVNKSVQWGSVAYVFVIVLVILAFHTWLTSWRLAGRVRTDGDGLSLGMTLLLDVLITFGVTGIFAAFAVIFGSHKIAGPIYRCEQTMKRVQRGDLTDFIRLRKGDFLVPFSEEINLALANLREIAGGDRIQVQEAVRQLTLAKGAIAAPEVQKTIDRAIDALGKVGTRLKIDQDAARAIVEGAKGGPAPPPAIGEISDAMNIPGSRSASPIYAAGKTMVLPSPDRRTLKGEQRAPGADLEKTLPAPRPTSAPPGT